MWCVTILPAKQASCGKRRRVRHGGEVRRHCCRAGPLAAGGWPLPHRFRLSLPANTEAAGGPRANQTKYLLAPFFQRHAPPWLLILRSPTPKVPASVQGLPPIQGCLPTTPQLPAPWQRPPRSRLTSQKRRKARPRQCACCPLWQSAGSCCPSGRPPPTWVRSLPAGLPGIHIDLHKHEGFSGGNPAFSEWPSGQRRRRRRLGRRRRRLGPSQSPACRPHSLSPPRDTQAAASTALGLGAQRLLTRTRPAYPSWVRELGLARRERGAARWPPWRASVSVPSTAFRAARR